VTNNDLGATFPGANMVQGKNTLGYLCTVYQRSNSQVRHIPPKMSDKCPTNVRQMSNKFESQHSLSPTIWSDILVGRESGY
jgi:hypothetical protein